MPSPDAFVTVARFPFVIEAESAKLHLGEEGIRAWVTGAEIVVADWALGNAVGDVRVEVAAADAERAVEILARMIRPTRNRSGDGETATGVVCQNCGAAMPEQDETCSECGWSFEPGTEATPRLPKMRRAARAGILLWLGVIGFIFISGVVGCLLQL